VTPPAVWQRLPHGKTLTSDAAKIHPGVQHCLESMPTAPFTVTDVLSERARQNSDIGRAMRPKWGRIFQLMVPIDTDRADPTWWVWVIGREHVDFIPADRQVASAIQPVLAAVTRHLATIQRAHVRADMARPLTGGSRVSWSCCSTVTSLQRSPPGFLSRPGPCTSMSNASIESSASTIGPRSWVP